MAKQVTPNKTSVKGQPLVSSPERSKEKLLFSELRYRRLFETAQDGILILDANTGKITDANPFLKKILGYSHSELLGKELWEIGFFKDIKESKVAFHELQNKGYIRYKDLPLQTKKGQSIAVEFVSNVYTVGTQRVIQCNIRDITDRRNIEKIALSRAEALEKLTKSQEVTKKAMLNVMEDLEEAKAKIEVEKAKDEAMFASIGEGLIAVDNDRKIMTVNKVAEAMLGWKRKDLIGKIITTLPLEDEEGNRIMIENRPTYIALSTGKTTSASYFFVRKDTTRIPLAINVTPIVIAGKTIGLIETLRDISREKEIDRAKSEFVSLASHQLRTPLGIAKWYIEVLISEGYLNNAPQIARDYLDEVYKSNERLLSLVRDLLSISRIDQGKVRNIPQSIRIVDLTTDIIKAMNILAEKNSVTLHLVLKKTKLPVVFVDSLRLQEVIENLIANAIAYSKPKGKIEVNIDIKGKNILFSVKDTGIGISATDKKKLFTRFFRSENAIVTNTEGSGLGLYVAKSYVDDWGGSISVVSTEGKGSTFTISLPVKMLQQQKKSGIGNEKVSIYSEDSKHVARQTI